MNRLPTSSSHYDSRGYTCVLFRTGFEIVLSMLPSWGQAYRISGSLVATCSLLASLLSPHRHHHVLIFLQWCHNPTVLICGASSRCIPEYPHAHERMQ